MDFKVLISTFGLIFLAELGDKTQIATLTFSMESKSPFSVFIGSATALVCTSFIAVYGASYFSKWIPMEWIPRIAGVLFIILGVFYLVKSK
ncbi:MAG: UPF0016 family membrane protein [bacterium]|nr:MAG: UPF0016 family membrane protein [bacterium]